MRVMPNRQDGKQFQRAWVTAQINGNRVPDAVPPCVLLGRSDPSHVQGREQDPSMSCMVFEPRALSHCCVADQQLVTNGSTGISAPL